MADRGRSLPPGWEPPPPGQVWDPRPGGPAEVPPAPVHQAYPTAAPPQAYPAAPPPGAHPPPGPRVLREGKHLGAPSVLTAVLLALAGSASAMVARAMGDRADLIDRLKTSSIPEIQEAVPAMEDADERVVVAIGLYALAYVCTGIAWVVWQRRFVRNAEPFAPVAPSLGWGTWGWLVPVAGLYNPPAQLANAARATDPVRVTTTKAGEAPPWLYLWWVTFVGSVLAQLASTWTRPAQVDLTSGLATIEEFEKADRLAALSYWAGAAAAAFGIATVLVCTSRQRKMLRALDVVV